MKDFELNINSTPGQFLMTLKMRGEQTSGELATKFDMTNEGARLHLQNLMQQDLISSESISKGVGRPQTMYKLTEKGMLLFPDTHADLSVQLLQSVRTELGEAALDKLITAREKEMTGKYLELFKKKQGIKQKLDLLVQLRSAEGYMAEWTEAEEGYLFVENHCPICAAATTCQGFCRAELNNFKKVLGDQVLVERTEHIVQGARRCAYLVKEKS